MPLDEADSGLFKAWVVKKLEAISDADSEVLADYVLALVKADDSEAVAKANCIENLGDFIGDSAESFVNDIFHAITTKSYDPSRPQPKSTAPVYQPPRRSSYQPPRLPNESHKRSYHEWDADGMQNGRIQSYESGDRPTKQPRRGGRGYESRGGRQSQQPIRGSFGVPPPSLQQGLLMRLPPMPTPPPGMPPFDPNNPLAALMAMGQAMGLMPPMSDTISPTAANAYRTPRTGRRCRDYDAKGFCTRGASCPYEHDDNALIVPQQNDEYDPSDATMFDVTPSRVGQFDAVPGSNGRGGGRGRGRGAGATYRGGRQQRAEFSMQGMNHNKSITSIVVEQIPEEHFNEQDVRDFFGDFGNIEEVTMQPYKRLAIVHYDSYEFAKAAYSSPKCVFDNRFVKVYWHKPDETMQTTNGHTTADANGDVNMEQDGPDVDHEEVARRQEAAQRKHDEAKRQRESAQKQRQELEEKLKAVDVERKKMAGLLAKKTGKAASPAPNEDHEDEQTKQLKAKLAELQSEALSLGIDPEADEPVANGYGGYPTYRGRGGYRGLFASRGRGYYQPTYRGAYGAGGFSGGRATMSLDNRPKTVAVIFADGQHQEHEEALRQYLMFQGLESATLTKHPHRDDAALVAFQQRFEGENIMAAAVYDGPLAASDLPKQLGKVELTWYKPEGAGGTAAVNGHGGDDTAKVEDAEVALPQPQYEPAQREDRDMDTYDE